MDLYTHFKQVIFALDDAEVEFLVVGGIALNFYVAPRTTVDIDLMILAQNVERAIEALKSLGYRQFDPTMRFGEVLVERLTYMEEGEQFLKVDLLIALGEPFLSIWHKREFFEYEGRRIGVVSRKGLIELKSLRGSPQDLVDIEKLKGAIGEEK